MNDWRERLEAIFPDRVAPDGLVPRAAAATAAMLQSSAYAAASLGQCRINRSQPGSAILFMEVEVAMGQRAPVNDIRHTEPVAIYYLGEGVEPFAYPLREDFPEDLRT